MRDPITKGVWSLSRGAKHKGQCFTIEARDPESGRITRLAAIIHNKEDHCVANGQLMATAPQMLATLDAVGPLIQQLTNLAWNLRVNGDDIKPAIVESFLRMLAEPDLRDKLLLKKVRATITEATRVHPC